MCVPVIGCNRPLQTEVKCIAVINLVYSLGLIVTEVILCFQIGIQGVQKLNPEFSNPNLDDESNLLNRTIGHNEIQLAIEHHNDNNDNYTDRILSVPVLQFTVSTVWILTWILDISFSFLLYHAAANRHIRNCQIWFYFRCSALVFRIIFLIMYVLAGFSIVPKIPVIVLFAIRIYSLWVVNKFVKELTEEKRFSMSLAPNSSNKIDKDVPKIIVNGGLVTEEQHYQQHPVV